jgi:hypothetical protein
MTSKTLKYKLCILTPKNQIVSDDCEENNNNVLDSL